jgi:ABC-type cobalt transport system substrate-binding protein
MRTLLLILFTILFSASYSQVSPHAGLYLAKEFSKEQALYKAKEYMMTEIINLNSDVTKFEIDPLAAANSGELTSLVYRCDEQGLGGLILGFFGDRWNENGVIYQAYAFKNLKESKAFAVIKRIETIMEEQSKYIGSDWNTNNVVFKIDDMTFLIYEGGGTKIRVFWNGFDSEWEETAFKRTRRRFARKIDG